MRKRLDILGWAASLLVIVVTLAADSYRAYRVENDVRAVGSLALALFLAVLFYHFRPRK